MQKQNFSILKVSPTGLGPSWLDVFRREDVDSRPDLSVRARKVGLVTKQVLVRILAPMLTPMLSCKSKAACKFSEKHQKQAPTATGLPPSNAVKKLLLKTGFKIEKGCRKVCFMVDLLLRKNFGPNVDVNFFNNNHNLTIT